MTTGIILLNFGEPAKSDEDRVVAYLERIFLANAAIGALSSEAARERARALAERRAPGLIEEYATINGSPLNDQSAEQARRLTQHSGTGASAASPRTSGCSTRTPPHRGRCSAGTGRRGRHPRRSPSVSALRSLAHHRRTSWPLRGVRRARLERRSRQPHRVAPPSAVPPPPYRCHPYVRGPTRDRPRRRRNRTRLFCVRNATALSRRGEPLR